MLSPRSRKSRGRPSSSPVVDAKTKVAAARSPDKSASKKGSSGKGGSPRPRPTKRQKKDGRASLSPPSLSGEEATSSTTTTGLLSSTPPRMKSQKPSTSARRQLSVVTASSASDESRSGEIRSPISGSESGSGAGSGCKGGSGGSRFVAVEGGEGAAAAAAKDDESVISISSSSDSVVSISSSSSLDDGDSTKPSDADADANVAAAAQRPPEPLEDGAVRVKIKVGNDDVPNDDASSAVAVLPPSPSSSSPQPRRSGRARKSTVVVIGGHVVKRINNYVVKGMTYVHDAFDASEPPQAKESASAPAKKPAEKKVRVVSEAERRRAEHNDKVKRRIESKVTRRKAFLASKVDAIAPFVEPAVERSLRTYKEENPDFVRDAVEEWRDMDVQPDGIQGDMRDYQMIGLNFMARMHSMNLGLILGDEMGLGKTLQTISLLCHLKERCGATGPSLVICPLSVLYSWCDELERWAPDLKYLRFHSSCVKEREAQRNAFKSKAGEYDVVVTTYEMAKSPSLTSLWRRQYFNCLVLDEGHKIKNHESQIAQGVRHIHSENRLILTGTPLQNNLVELWSLLNFLYPDVFTDMTPFGEAFDIGNNAVDKEMLSKAHELLGLFMIRRMKTEVEKLMPKKIETRVLCPLSTTQIFWYKALLMKDVNLLARVSEKAADGNEKPVLPATARGQLQNLMMQLRKCCIHPFLFDGAETDINETTLEELVAASGKLAVLDKLLRSLFRKGHRVVLFSQFTSVLDILEDYCNMRGWRSCRFDGSTPRARRNFTVTSFNAPDSDDFLFLMSTRSGGMGLNLQTADTCVLFDSDWNPQPDLQAMARVHRIGQKKTVHVYRLVAGGTVEERMVERAEKKLYLDKMVNRGADGADDSGGGSTGLSASELLSSLKFGCDAIFGNVSRNALPSDEDVEAVTDRSRTAEDRSSSVGGSGLLRGGTTRTAKDFDANVELKSVTKFGGVDFMALRDEQRLKKKGKEQVPSNLRDVAVQWSKIQTEEKRKRKQRLLMVKGIGSGYGSAYVPVLASNNYELNQGESSVFNRELGGRGGDYTEKKKSMLLAGRDFQSQDMCQVCGEGREEGEMDLLHCPRCPVSLHSHCAGVFCANQLMCCSHHKCTTCHKDWTAAGGLLFPCQSCPVSYCEDCLPKTGGMRLLGECDRFEKLGYNSTKKFCYIHCSAECEEVAAEEFGWSPARRIKPVCPDVMDVSHNFGRAIDETVLLEDEESKEGGRRRRRSASGRYPYDSPGWI